MKNKTYQSGFTLIELIAVMVILGILAAVIVPRIATLTSGAYESNVRSMFGVIKNEVNAQALKAAMTGGASGHRETYPEADNATKNHYLKSWVEDFDPNYWSNYITDNSYNNATNKVHSDHAATAAILFMYHPHGEMSNGKVTWASAAVATGGSSAMLEDNYWIYYAPLTTGSGSQAGRDKDGYIMAAFRDDGDAKFEPTFANGVITAGEDEELTDIQWITP